MLMNAGSAYTYLKGYHQMAGAELAKFGNSVK